VSFSVGGFFGGAFFHLIPEAAGESGFTLETSAYILTGVFFSYILEEFLMWRHSHTPTPEGQLKRLGYMNLFGDAFHNAIDGLIIGGAYLVSVPLGLATSLAVLLHELPQEIGDFAVLLYSGFTVRRAIAYNFVSSLTAYIGLLIALLLGTHQDSFTRFLLPFTAGSFIYIAGSDLIPEIRGETQLRNSMVKLAFIFSGLLLLFLLRE
jgi:zinc and cadmium transporter